MKNMKNRRNEIVLYYELFFIFLNKKCDEFKNRISYLCKYCIFLSTNVFLILQSWQTKEMKFFEQTIEIYEFATIIYMCVCAIGQQIIIKTAFVECTMGLIVSFFLLFLFFSMSRNNFRTIPLINFVMTFNIHRVAKLL